MDQLKANGLFSNWEEFEVVLKQYCTQNNFVFTKRCANTVETANKKIVRNPYLTEWKYKSVTLQCKHFGVKEETNSVVKKRETE